MSVIAGTARKGSDRGWVGRLVVGADDYVVKPIYPLELVARTLTGCSVISPSTRRSLAEPHPAYGVGLESGGTDPVRAACRGVVTPPSQRFTVANHTARRSASWSCVRTSLARMACRIGGMVCWSAISAMHAM